MTKAEGWEDRARKDLEPKVRGSAFVITLNPADDIDPKIALETGYAVLLNKPILVVNWKGRVIPPGLRRIATEVVEVTGPLDSLEGQVALQAAIGRLMGEPS